MNSFIRGLSNQAWSRKESERLASMGYLLCVVITGKSNRADLIRQGRSLEYFTIIYNGLEGIIAVVFVRRNKSGCR